MNLSKHFSIEEFCFSQTASRLGIKNVPTGDTLAHLKVVAESLELVRSALRELPIRISSGYRCLALNRAIGSKDSSAHVLGWAVDFTCAAYGTPKQIVEGLLAADTQFDQLINEQDWVHISFDPRMRGEVLTAKFIGGKATYTKGI